MTVKHIEAYAKLMKEVKLRTAVIDALRSGNAHETFPETRIESIYLQLRKILELIALGSLVANHDALAKIVSTLGDHWNAKTMFRDIKKVNPDFYPHPVVDQPSTVPGATNELVPLVEGTLTKEDFVHLYDRCGGLLHAANPLGRTVDYDRYAADVPKWLGKIVTLLSSHKIHLLGDTGFWLVHMREEGDNEVHFYRFDLVGPVAAH